MEIGATERTVCTIYDVSKFKTGFGYAIHKISIVSFVLDLFW